MNDDERERTYFPESAMPLAKLHAALSNGSVEFFGISANGERFFKRIRVPMIYGTPAPVNWIAADDDDDCEMIEADDDE